VRQPVRRVRVATIAPWLLAILLGGVYTVLSVARYQRFASRSWDLAIFDVALRDYAHLRAPLVGIKGPHFNLLGDHFSPLLIGLAPFYRVFPTPVTLLVAQATLFAVSAVPVARVAMRHLGEVSGLAVGAAYGLSWGLVQAVDFDFHEVCLAVPLLAFALEAYLNQQWRLSAAWALPLVLVKEDLGLTVAMLGVCVAMRGNRRLGTSLAAFGVVCTAVTVTVIMPMISSEGRYAYWDLLTTPGHRRSVLAVAQHVLTPWTKVLTVVLVFAVTGFLALRSVLSLLVAPTLVWRFLASSPAFWGWDWHYSAILMPIVFVALVDGAMSAGRSDRRWVRTYGARASLAVVLPVAIGLAGQLPIRDLFAAATYSDSARIKDVREGLTHIPSGSSVEASKEVIGHLASRCTVYLAGTPTNPIAEFVAVDAATAASDTAAIRYAQTLHPAMTYFVVYESSEFRVVQRRV
jgi:uncharacterized membrane protein